MGTSLWLKEFSIYNLIWVNFLLFIQHFVI